MREESLHPSAVRDLIDFSDIIKPLLYKGAIAMIEAKCGCGWTWARQESATQTAMTCRECGKVLSIACAETLADGSGSGDFDAVLDVLAGPSRVGERICLGGVVQITMGKLEGSHVHLPGNMVSRQHCRLARMDFGPSKWSISDNQSTKWPLCEWPSRRVQRIK